MGKMSILGAIVALQVFVLGAVAWATTPPTPDEVLTDTAQTVFDSLMATAQGVLPYAALLSAFYIGWRIVKRFLR